MEESNERTASQDRYFRESGPAADLAALVEPVLADLGFRLVRVQLSGKEGQTLQIMAERPDGTMSVERLRAGIEAVCRRCSTHTIRCLAPIGSRFPRPASTGPSSALRDFEDWAGFEARIELNQPVNGRKRFRGVLEGFEDGEVGLECELDQVGVQVLGFPGRADQRGQADAHR